MTIPAGYTSDSLAAYLHGLLEQAKLDGVLGWTAPDSYGELIIDVLLALNIASLASQTTPLQVRRVRAVGRVMLWRAVKAGLTLAYDFSDSAVGGSGSWSRSQMGRTVDGLLAMAEQDASSAGVNITTMPPARIIPVAYPEDPYGPGRWNFPLIRRRTP
jgi:hypothetical protein